MTADDLNGLIEMTLVFGVVLGFAVYELVSLRRSQRHDRAQLFDQDNA
jgi:hypothetical protein